MITRQITVWCDRCSRWKTISTNLVKNAEWAVRNIGWVVVHTKQGKKHYCNRC